MKEGRNYRNFGFIIVVLYAIAILSLTGGVIGAAIAVLQQYSARLDLAVLYCLSGLIGLGLFGGMAVGLVVLRDVAADQRRTANAMERIANRGRGGS